jgi:hypothetical protein
LLWSSSYIFHTVMGRNSLEGKWKEFFTQRILVYHNQFSKAKTPTMKLSSTYGQSVVVFHKSCFATFPLTPITKSSFEKSAGALGADRPRWDPFVKAAEAFIRKERGGFRRGWAQMGPFRKRARLFCGLSQIIKKRRPGRARGTHRARWT